MQLDKSDGRYAMNYMRNMLFIIVTLSVLIYKYYIYFYLFFTLLLKDNFPQLSSCENGISFEDSVFLNHLFHFMHHDIVNPIFIPTQSLYPDNP